ncbi:MAG: NADP-dependent malic enzyme [Clostridia bacterium]|nr:NADP-dependent malic enzyme [Clostridia bacterium]MDD4665733.1 NADP-dependent malic enzyme [Clostridia bacterium]
MDYMEKALQMHQKLKGKLSIHSKVSLQSQEELSLAYTPGVAEPCKLIAQDKTLAYEYTMKANFIAVVSDGTAVLGLGDIGPEAALPVMEGKCVLFKEFGGVDAVPLCIGTTDVEEIVEFVVRLAPTFGGINLEDISSPRCFAIERKLKERLDIPVFHDDQHGTAVVVLAALINAAKVVGKEFKEMEVVVNGAGAAGISIAQLLKVAGIKDVILCNRGGAIYQGCPQKVNSEQARLAPETNLQQKKGLLGDVLQGADVFIGVSRAGLLTKEMVRRMKKEPIVLALANPLPEIFPEEALAAGAKVVGTGRSDYPNQINNVLAFPGLFRGALDVRATEINEEMKFAAAQALAELITPEELTADYLLPQAFDLRVGPRVAAAVAEAAVKSGAARKKVSYEEELAQAVKLTKKNK